MTENRGTKSRGQENRENRGQTGRSPLQAAFAAFYEGAIN